MERPLFAPRHLGLMVDLYQLMQLAVFHADGMWGESTFDLTLQRLPSHWGYAVCAGVEEAIEAIAALRFAEEDRHYLQHHPAFAQISDTFFQWLREYRFTGDVWALPEGAVAFPGTPVLRVSAPLLQAAIVENLLLQPITTASAVATRASRISGVAGGRSLFEVGSRRCPGGEASLLSARAAAVGGFSATSHALAGAVHGLEVMGTLSEGIEAVYGGAQPGLEAYLLYFGQHGMVGLPAESDESPEQAVARLRAYRGQIRLVRLKRGPDLASYATRLRALLDADGMGDVQILGAGQLNEGSILALGDAPLDALAVGRALTMGEGPTLTYRLVEYWRGMDPEPIAHRPPGPAGGKKQVRRTREGDEVARDEGQEGRLVPYIQRGRLVRPLELPALAHQRREAELAALPEGVRRLHQPEVWPVRTVV